MTPAEIERIKELLPTRLGSDELRSSIAADILRRSVFSAKMASAPYLAKVREVCAAILDGTLNQAEARTRLLSILEQIGYDPQGPEELTNPASERRLNLILDTQRQMAANVSRLMQQDEGTLERFPGWELCRMGSRRVPREDWPARWREAGKSVGWRGAVDHPIQSSPTSYSFLALKTSPIWQALGDGAGGFTDTLNNPYPPFAYSSGMGWLDADRKMCEKYGLDVDGGALGDRPLPTLSPGDRDILDAVKRYGLPKELFDLRLFDLRLH